MKKTREECIAQIFRVADDWGIDRPVITERTSTEALQNYCKKLDRRGRALAKEQK